MHSKLVLFLYVTDNVGRTHCNGALLNLPSFDQLILSLGYATMYAFLSSFSFILSSFLSANQIILQALMSLHNWQAFQWYIE